MSGMFLFAVRRGCPLHLDPPAQRQNVCTGTTSHLPVQPRIVGRLQLVFIMTWWDPSIWYLVRTERQELEPCNLTVAVKNHDLRFAGDVYSSLIRCVVLRFNCHVAVVTTEYTHYIVARCQQVHGL
jgi:hypothetical protein